MSNFVWLRIEAVLSVHGTGLQLFGGPPGVRDMNLLESALARPKNLNSFGDVSDPAALAASYAFGIAKNHPFIDGNKRAAFLSALMFLELNGFEIDFEETDAIETFFGLAAGSVNEDDLATWIRAHCVACGGT